VTSDGRPCVNAYSYKKHPLRPKLELVLDYLGLSAAAHVDFFTATVTPYTFKTQWVRELVLEVGEGSKPRFAQEFVAKELTEFFLYAGWLVRTGRDLPKVLFFHQRFCGVVWPELSSEGDVQDRVAVASEAQAPIFSVHRNALVGVTSEGRALLARFWVSRGLFQSEEEAQKFVDRFRSNYSSQSTMLYLRTLPYEFSRLRRRAARRLGLVR
jgi:hypothetical protein